MAHSKLVNASNAGKEFAMSIPHRRYHWIAVAIALAALLLTLNEAHGQGTGAAATFEGRPAMAGAQGGVGAQAGPPTGGIGVQGTDAAQRSVAPPGTGLTRDMPPPRGDARGDAAATEIPAPAESEIDKTPRRDVKPAPDKGMAKDQHSSVSKGKRAAKRTFTRGRHGSSEIDS
jgi:hypothetical protein